ncbi:MAG: helix-turn-helix transcriptional regulator [Clostridia bacterium]|nr:helix-turn-helix transcriptional regulator [Clostridia bacterium]
MDIEFVNFDAEPSGSSPYHRSHFGGTLQNPVLHTHANHEILYVRQGHFTAISENLILTSSTSCLIIYQRNCKHAQFNIIDTTYERYCLQTFDHIKPEIHLAYSRFCQHLTQSIHIIPLTIGEVDWMFQVCGRLEILNREKDNPAEDEQVLYLYQYLLEETVYLLEHHKPLTQSPVESSVPEVLAFIAEHIGEKLTIERIASSQGIGKTKLCTDFKNTLSVPLHQYIISERLALALRLLKEGASQEETAWKAGFNDVPHFIRMFTRYYGMTPAKYLKHMKE